ncbi:hypothetical protein [Tropicimonas sp. S265A]|uniref:hypothetical protein n=1 Tax=Tropicimonas sp. S265A TaxID=3415134 RepID=UPI003C79BE9C
MTRRIVGWALFALAAAAIFYVSRFWDFRLWSGGLFGVEMLRPQGGLVAVWLRGTPLAPYELLVWLVGGFLSLSLLEWLFNRLWPLPPSDT